MAYAKCRPFLRYSKIDFDPAALTDAMVKLEAQLEDELSEVAKLTIRT